MKKLTSYCKVCNSEVFALQDIQFNMIYEKCSNCGFIHLANEHHVSFDEERAEYDLHENSIEDEGYVNYLDRFLVAAVDSFIKEGNALDFGCGPEAVLAELLMRRGFSTKTYDRHFDHDADALETKYDLITSTEVFEHFHDPRIEMEKISALLNSGGILAIMTSVPPDEEKFMKWGYRREQTHISFFTKKSLEILGAEFNLEVVYHDNKHVTVFRKH